MDLLCALGWVGKREVTPIVCSESIADGKLPLAIGKFHAVNFELPPRVAGIVVQWVELLHDVATVLPSHVRDNETWLLIGSFWCGKVDEE